MSTQSTLADHFPKGTWFILPPWYTVEYRAILRVESPPVIEPVTLGSLRRPCVDTHILSCDAYWPDGGYCFYPYYRVHYAEDMVAIVHPMDNDQLTMLALAQLEPVDNQHYVDFKALRKMTPGYVRQNYRKCTLLKP